MAAAAAVATPTTWKIRPYIANHSDTWPYTPADFSRADARADSDFYAAPRFVAHIDDAAISALQAYYAAVLPWRHRRVGGDGGVRILDFCSSWLSHYPPEIADAAAAGELHVVGLGMNRAELDANPVLNAGRLLCDLNVDPDVCAALQRSATTTTTTATSSSSPSSLHDGDGGSAEGVSEQKQEPSSSSAPLDASLLLDASTNTVSVDYLTQPVAVLRSVRAATRLGGTVHLAVSNRCFPTKAIRRWLHASEQDRLQMVADFLHFAGWKQIEIVELSDGAGVESDSGGGGLQGFMSALGMTASRDPLWVVRAVKE